MNEDKKFGTRTEQVLNQIENFITYDGFHIKWTEKFVVPFDEFKGLLDELNESVKSDLLESQEIKELRHQILEEATNEADILVKKAQEALEDQDVIRKAHEYAHYIALEAQRKADEMLSEAEEIKHQLIAEGYQFLEKMMDQTQIYMNDARLKIEQDAESLQENRKKMQEKIKEELHKMRTSQEKKSKNQHLA